MIPAGAIDCDIHLPVPGARELLPYLDDFWQDMIVSRGMDRLDLASLQKSPMSMRPDWQPPEGGACDLDMLRSHLLDRWDLRVAICNCLHGAVALQSEDMGAALVGAVNDWVADKWLRHEPRLRASILVHAENPARAAEEIEKRAGDDRFVQVLLLVMQYTHFGKRTFWPVFEAAEKHDLPVALHAGSLYRNPPSALGWPSYHVNDCVNQSMAFQTQLMSMLMEGVFTRFPRLKVVLLESGFTWMPNFLWRANKTWKGTRTETPWLNRPPADIVRESVRLAVQPFDGPPEPDRLQKVLGQIGSDDIMLFSTDYPHWHFDGDDALDAGISPELAHRITHDNPQSTYSRLGGLG
jgi:hypothetical protein